MILALLAFDAGLINERMQSLNVSSLNKGNGGNHLISTRCDVGVELRCDVTHACPRSYD